MDMVLADDSRTVKSEMVAAFAASVDELFELADPPQELRSLEKAVVQTQLSLLTSVKVLMAVTSLVPAMALLTAYGAGLRVGEVCRLRVEDIDSKRGLIHVRLG